MRYAAPALIAIALWYWPLLESALADPSFARRHRDRERESGTGAVMRLAPQATVVVLDDGPADRKADAHTILFRSVEGVEEPVQQLRRHADPGVPYAQARGAVCVTSGLDQDLLGTVVDGL